LYAQIDDDKSGFIDLQELNKALEMVGIRIPGYELRDLVAAADREKDDRIDIEEFKDVRTIIASSLPYFCKNARSRYANSISSLNPLCPFCNRMRIGR